MRPFDEIEIRAGIIATLEAWSFESAPIRAGQEGSEIRPPMVTVLPPGYVPLGMGEGGFVVPEATWPLFLYVDLSRTDAETQLADFTAATLAALMSDRRLSGTVAGLGVSSVETPQIVEFASATAGRPGRKMLRRQVTLQTRHR